MHPVLFWFLVTVPPAVLALGIMIVWRRLGDRWAEVERTNKGQPLAGTTDEPAPPTVVRWDRPDQT